MSESKNDLWSAGRGIQYFLICIAIAAIGYTSAQMRNLAEIMDNIDDRLTRLETNTSGLIKNQLDDLEDRIKDHETRIRALI